MNKRRKNITHIIPRIVGLILIFLSVLVLAFPNIQNDQIGNDFLSASFLVNYFFAIGFFLFILIRHIIYQGWNIFRIDGGLIRLFVILFTISSFSLNQAMNLFSVPTLWLKAYLVIVFFSLILYAYKHKLPESLREPMFFLFGMGVTISLFFIIFLLPISLFGIAFSWFFGIPLHGAVQFIWLAVFLVPLFKTKNKFARISFLTGAIIPLLFLAFFMFKYAKTQEMVSDIYAQNNNDLPEWVTLSQNLPDDNFTSWALKSKLIYETKSNWWDFDPWMSNSFRELEELDPMIVVCNSILGDLDIDWNNQTKILETKFKYRHEAIPRLWSDDHLITKKIESEVEIMPEYRIAYIEKKITIKNEDNNSWWTPEEEAIYSFHMPEGAVATSLSLWVAGVEQKARLTTKEKADSAYNTIVGVEIRDPSLVTWQEGNRLVVRVFPCTQEEDRIFKLGFTTPLQYSDGELKLKNIYFEGPDYTNTKESISLSIISKQDISNINVPSFLKKSGEKYSYHGKYKENWEVTITDCKISDAPFSFNGKSYHTEALKRKQLNFDPKDIYLDINNSWSESEFNDLWDIISDKNIYIFNGEIQKLTDDNKRNIFMQLHQLNFSLFPIYEIKNPEQSLLITKSEADSPILADIEETSFSDKTYDYLSGLNGKIFMYNLSENYTIYIKTLKEFGTFHYNNGDIFYLDELLTSKKFPVSLEQMNAVNLEYSDMRIVMDTIPENSQAPDHLMRLYAYNEIMKKLGRNFFNKEYINDELIAIAKAAYVVTPVSSLVVLETQDDYDRFDIEAPDSNLSLENAMSSSSGSVPEPHEWVLIILCSVIAIILFGKRVKLF